MSNVATMQAVRLAHLSDVHLTSRPLGWQWRDWFSKRLTGWINSRVLSRRRRFRRADEVLRVLIADLGSQRRPDCVIFSGDATMLGFPGELARAAAALGVGSTAMPPGLAVPGNHDYYTPAVERSGGFENYFAPWLDGQRLDEGPIYPFARKVGPVWLVGVNSCSGNRWPWNAVGRVGDAQLHRLGRLLETLGPGPRILVTHYPVGLADGQPEGPLHRLRDLDDLLVVAERGGVSLWLHGHRHDPYRLNDPRVAPFPVICAGSATQSGHWGYNEYTIDGLHLQGVRRTFDLDRRCFRDSETFELKLRS